MAKLTVTVSLLYTLVPENATANQTKHVPEINK